MNAGINFILAMSCAIPAFVGLYRYNRIDRKYHLFIYMMLLDWVTELIIYLAGKSSTAKVMAQVTVNIYTLLYFILFIRFVYQNQYLSKRTVYLLLGAAGIAAMANFIYLRGFSSHSFYLLLFGSLVMLFISINILSKQILELKVSIARNFWFWVSCCWVLYNAFNLLIFGLYFLALFNTANGKAIGIIQHFVNAACYLVYAVIIFRIPERGRLRNGPANKQ
ncbi:MAG: hypothetical protein U0X40_09780 [Ferruginibacter sp.]